MKTKKYIVTEVVNYVVDARNEKHAVQIINNDENRNLRIIDSKPRAVKEAAVRDNETKNIYTGSWHGEAFEKAEADIGRKIKSAHEFEEGFITNEGEFLDRLEATQRAVEMEQIPKEVGQDYAYLEATRLERFNKESMGASVEAFQPKQLTDSYQGRFIEVRHVSQCRSKACKPNVRQNHSG